MVKKCHREKFDATRRELFLDLMRKGVRRYHACKKVGISRTTLAKYINNNDKFAAEVVQAEMDANELVEQAMFKSAINGNVTAQQVWLYNRDPERWRDKRNVTIPQKTESDGFLEALAAKTREVWRDHAKADAVQVDPIQPEAMADTDLVDQCKPD